LRKLLIKLVAIETILVGWLSYWLFLVYANNPAISAELASSLQRFPQLSFSTIDIAVMVIIAALAVTLAFKFQRGLRPGIRLERALQMLENLMKRNLVLESQVAELKIEKTHTPPIITSAPTPPVLTSEPRPGSWEKAFRTPLEAGPPITSKAGTASDENPFAHETGIPPPRIESKPQPSPSMIKPPILINDRGTAISAPPPVMAEKPLDKTSYPTAPKTSASSWEDSPQLITETRGILTPSTSTRKVPTISDSGGLRQPYIPAPVPKPAPAPPSVILGPMPSPSSSPSPPKISSSPIPRITARPTSRSMPPKTSTYMASPPPPAIETPKLEDVLPTLAPPPISLQPNPPKADESLSTIESTTPKPSDTDETADEKTSSKPVQTTRKKLSLGGN
jgi:hypothetical protein